MLWEGNISERDPSIFTSKRNKCWIKTNNGKSWVEMGIKAELVSESIDVYIIGSILPIKNVRKWLEKCYKVVPCPCCRLAK